MFRRGPYISEDLKLTLRTLQHRPVKLLANFRSRQPSHERPFITVPRAKTSGRRSSQHLITPVHFLIRTMSDDASYMSFLNKANTDPKSGQGSTMAESDSTSQRRSDIDPTSSSSSEALPASLKSLPDVTYTSDTDSPFEPVLFGYSGADLPSAEEFKKVLKHAHKGKGGNQEDIEELNTKDFDPRGQYKEIIQRVAQAGKGDLGVKVFRIQSSSTRVEYYIVTVGERNLVGVMAKAVES